MMNIAWITGGRGFIGRNLSKLLANKGMLVHGLGHGAWSDKDFSAWHYQSWLNAEVETSSLNQIASESGFPNVVFHLAGGSTVGQSIEHPYEDFKKTVDTTARLLEWVREFSPTTKVVATSSAAVYGAKYKKAISEDALIDPYSPYGFHKFMLENLFSLYRETYNLDLSVIRFFSVYGAGLEKQLLWDLCGKLARSNQREIILSGSGNEVRDWLHVQDAVKLLEQVGSAKENAIKVLNGGTGIPTSIKQVTSKVINAWGEGFTFDFDGVARNGDPQSLLSDVTQAQAFGFEPLTSLDDGIAEVVKWYKASAL